MRKALILIGIMTLHFIASILLIPDANKSYQQYFDTGEAMSRVDHTASLIASILSFPIASWSLAVHPVYVSFYALVLSVAANSFLWGIVGFLILSVCRKPTPK